MTQRVAVWAIAFGSALGTAYGQAFRVLPALVGTDPAYVYGVSGDGRVVVGQANPHGPSSAEINAVAWRDGVIQDLGRLGGFGSAALGASRDGSVLVGFSDISSGAQTVPVRYANGQITQLLNYPQGWWATSCSEAGSTIAGYGYGSGAFRWTSGGTDFLQPLSGLPVTQAWGVSGDGRTVVGFSSADASNTNPGRAVRWVDGGPPVALPLPAGYTYRTSAKDISPDGAAIVGSIMDAAIVEHAGMWLNNTPIDLGALPVSVHNEVPKSRAIAVAANGRAVVGITGRSGNVSAWIFDPITFYWTPQGGMVDLKLLLQSTFGVNMSGWVLDNVTGISDDGRVIVGNGRDPLGVSRPWIATVPSPGGLGVLVGAWVLVWRRRCRNSRN